jgi:hypothetical protein
MLQTVDLQLCGYATWLECCSQHLAQLKTTQILTATTKLKEKVRVIQGLEADKQQLLQLLALDEQQLAVNKKACAMSSPRCRVNGLPWSLSI